MDNPDRQKNTSITEIMERSYIDYSMSVIISRALPDARDGLKPVQRRILYAMLREGLLHNRAFDKCAGVVGEVLKNYHPHGDASVYDTLVRMAQNWVMRYPLINPQGNFGSVDGDPPAAYRYTECKLTNLAEDLLSSIDEDTVDFAPNYKESTTEPTVLPCGLPNLLMNGSTGIAVGMTTNIPPHNLGELVDATCAIIENPLISIDEIMQIIPGPDFPTGGSIVGVAGIEKYMRTGRGIVRIRGKAHIEETGNDREAVIITEIPYAVNRANLITKIAELITDKVISEASDLRDESDEKTRIVIELKRGESSRVLLNKLAKHTPFEASFGVILLALDKRRPKQMNIKEMIECYIEHRRDVVYRRTQFRLRKAEDRAHLLEGYKIALDNLDDFVKIIRASTSREDARGRIMAKYPLSERQTNAILELRLYQLTGLERDKIEAEYLELLKLIEELRSILENEPKLLAVIKEELIELRTKYADERRCDIIPAEGEFRMEDIIANEGCIITVTHKGFIKRTSVSEYRSQKRGGKGVIGSGQHTEDFIQHLFTAATHDSIMFFMNSGRVYVEKVYEIPEGTRTSKGRAISNVLELQEGERIANMICIPSLDEEGVNLVFATKRGYVKKTALKAFANVRRGGIRALTIEDDDELIGVKLTNGENEISLVTHHGLSIRFPEGNIRTMGRTARGVTGIRFKKADDFVEAVDIVDHEATLLIAGENGVGKRTSFEEYRVQSRGGSGIIAIRTDSVVAGALAVYETDEIMMLTEKGQAVRSPVRDIRATGRATQGVRLINLANNDRLVAICRIVEVEEEESEELLENTESNAADAANLAAEAVEAVSDADESEETEGEED